MSPIPLFAARVLQVLTWIFSLGTLLLNVILILSIRRERQTDNRFRWFNSMFLYSVYSNTLILILYTAIQPVLLPARSLIYLVFIGPVGWVLPRSVLRILYCAIIGVTSFQVFLPAISTFLRWLVVTKKISCMRLDRQFIGPIYLLSIIPSSVISLIYMHFPNQFNSENQAQLDEEAVLQLTGSHYVFIAAKLSFAYIFLITIISALLLSWPLTFTFHKLFMKSIRTLSNDLIDLGYQDSSAVSCAFLSFSTQNALLITIPHLILSVSVILEYQLGVRAIMVTSGLLWVPLTSAVSIFARFRAYRRQSGFLVMEFLHSKNVQLQLPGSPKNATSAHVEIPMQSMA